MQGPLVRPFLVCAIFVLSLQSVLAEERRGEGGVRPGNDTMWAAPSNIASRNLFYGPGGEQAQPHGPMTFLEEDSQGTNPKLNVRDHDGNKWRVKMGVEARPETVATRLLWAIGYFADEDYFLPSLEVEKMPPHLGRGDELVRPGGILQNVRLERHIKGEERLGQWRWKKNPLTGTREFNGLRVMMALINNWDLKNQNNAIYEEDADPSHKHYVVSDLGATFGTTGYSWTQKISKGNLNSYRHSKFITKVGPEYVDFNVPTRPALIYFFSFGTFFTRVRMKWIGKHIPREDAKWTGDMMARLSPEQIRDAFRAGGYSPDEVEGFAKVLEARIAELNKL